MQALAAPKMRSATWPLLLCVMLTEAHLASVCTTSDPGTPNTLRFWFGTYHVFSGTPPGTATITELSSGTVFTTTFSDLVSSGTSAEGFENVADIVADMRQGAPQYFTDETLATCWSTMFAESLQSDGQTWALPVRSDQMAKCYPRRIKSYAVLTLAGVSTSDYLLQTSGTNDKFDPAATDPNDSNAVDTGERMCMLSDNFAVRLFALSVAQDGDPCQIDQARVD